MKTTYTDEQVEEAKEGWNIKMRAKVKETNNPGFTATRNTYIW